MKADRSQRSREKSSPGGSGKAAAPVSGRSFEEAYRELEETVRRMEEGSLPLEESIALFERCVELLKYCQGLLDKADLRVRALLPTEEGPRLVDFPVEEDE